MASLFSFEQFHSTVGHCFHLVPLRANPLRLSFGHTVPTDQKTWSGRQVQKYYFNIKRQREHINKVSQIPAPVLAHVHVVGELNQLGLTSE